MNPLDPKVPPTMDGRLIVLVGPSGAGKTTLAHRLIAANPGRRAFSVSHTTRPQRPQETHGVDYYFVTRTAFVALRDQGGFAESAEVHGNLYGTSRAEIERLGGARSDILFDVDIQGAHSLWHQYATRCRLCFVLPPSWAVLVARLEGRGTESEATLRRRLGTALRELQVVVSSPAPWLLVENDAIDTAVEVLETLLRRPAPAAGAFAALPAVQAFLAAARADPRAQGDAVGA